MSSLAQLNIKNIDVQIKEEFTETAKTMKVSQAYLFETIWKFYREQYLQKK